MIPTTEPAQKIAIMFKRKLTTPWSDKEIRMYKKLVKDKCFTSFNDLELLERYYAFERRKQDKGIHRRDLLTFLNNYSGELDRARAWDVQFRRPRQRIEKALGEPISDEDFKRLGDLARKEMERLRERLRPT